MPKYRVTKLYLEYRRETYEVEAENGRQAIVETQYNDPIESVIQNSKLAYKFVKELE